jgi:serine/threonine-protein kinase
MVGAFGEVQVMDWGLAKVLVEGGVAGEERPGREREDVTTIRTARSSGSTGGGTATEAGSLLGTPAYMPPEQANGDVALLDRRADVFGLGAILCEILTGKPPYVGRSAEEVRRKAANGDLAGARNRLDACGADAELISLTVACLSAEVMDRPKDAQAVADALTAYLDGVQARLHQAELAEAAARARAAEESKRRRLTVALAATVLAALALGGGGWLWVQTEREDRRARLAHDVHEAVTQATALREQARAANVGAAALFARAREQALRALALAQSGPADAALAAQVRQLQTELDEEEKDRKLLAALDAARLTQADIVAGENRFAPERAVPLFREALAAYGLPAGEGEPAAAAERIRERPAAVREALIAALDEWTGLAAYPALGINEPHLDWLKAVVEKAETEDGWTRQLRAAWAEKDAAKRRQALERLAESADVKKLPAPALTRLTKRLGGARAWASAVKLLWRAWKQYPADFWVNHDLGLALQEVRPPDLAGAVRFLSVAMALRPDSAVVRSNLASALANNGQLNEAITYNRQALELDPTFAPAHYNLGNVLRDTGRLDEAIACFQKAIEFAPRDVRSHYNLGNALMNRGRLDEAIACHRKAVELDPKSARVHSGLGAALGNKGRLDEAITCFRKAVELDPKYAAARANLGNALYLKGQLDEALACFQKAVELDPERASDHYHLGKTLLAKGRRDEALACFRKAVELDPKDAEVNANLGFALDAMGHGDEAIKAWRRSVRLQPKQPNIWYWIARAERSRGRRDEAAQAFGKVRELYPPGSPRAWEAEQFLKGNDVHRRFAGVLAGSDRPADAAEGIWFAQECQTKKLYRAAARLYAGAFAADPKLADDLRAGYRYDAACFAALAAAGQGEDAAKLDATERGRLRRQALDCLRADLTLRIRQLQGGTATDRAAVRQALRHWQQDNDLAGIRDQVALAKLPAEERATFAKLWADVAALLKQTEGKP